MKPDGVVTAAMEPMETLDSDPVNEPAPVGGPEPNQVPSPAQEDASQPPVGDTGKVDPEPDQAKETPTAKPNNKTSDESKAKTANKTPAKTKTGTGPAKTTPGSRPSTTQSRLSNGVSKPQSNGMAKKTPPAAVKKTPTTTPPLKKPAGPAAASTTPKTKVGEKKPAGTTAPTNGTKPAAGAVKKTPSSSAANGVKSSSTPAKKPTAAKPAAAAPSKPSSTASPKPSVSKTSRPSTGSAAPSPRPSTTSTTKSSPAAPKAAASKTSSAAKPAPKPTSSTPSAGKPPAAQASRNATPAKKDVSKPGAPGARKPAESPLARASSATKSTKPETTKTAPKPEAAKKPPAATKTPSRKPQDAKTPSKDASKTPASKTPAAKNSSPKKAVGSSTPTPVKRAAKPAAAPEPEQEVAAAVAAAAAIATAAAAIAGSEGPEPEPVEPTPGPEVAQEPTPEPVQEPTPEPIREPTPEPIREPTPEPVREPTPEPIREPTPEPVREPTPEPIREPTPEPVREPTPEPIREPTPEPVREPTPEPVREPTPEPIREPTPEPEREPTPELVREPTPEPVPEPTPEPVRLVSPEQPAEPDLEYEPVHEPVSQKDLFKFEGSTNESVPSLGTTVMSPPCSPPGPVSPVREPQSASSLLDMGLQADPWDRNQVQALSDFAPQSLVDPMNFQTREEESEDQPEVQEEKEDLFTASSTAPSAGGFSLLGTSPVDQFSQRQQLVSPHEKEEAVEKAEEEINEDDEEDDDEDEEQRRLGHMITDMSVSQPSEDFQVRSSAFGGSAGWHGDDLLSGMDSEDVSSCTSSRQQGVSDLSSTQHTAILEGTQSSDALVDSSLRGSEGDGNLMGSPNVETLANEEEDEDEEDERVDDMDLSSERVEEHHKVFQQQERDEEEDDEDVEMHSEGVTESCGNEDEDFNEDERVDNLNRAAPASSSWGQTNPFSDPWAQPTSLLAVSSPSPMSDRGPLESETPTLSPAQARLDCSAPAFDDELEQRRSAHQTTTASSEELLAAPAAVAPAHSGSETSTPEELRDYDSSSGVESRSDKQQTPVPAAVQPDMEQDLGIHLEKGDGEEEEAETLPADEVLGTGPPTAPASAPSSASTSGDEASDTEGEMQINDPDAPATMDESAGFDSPTPTANLPALDEDEEAGDAAVGDAEEDGGGATPQSANSVASYGFDCTTSNSNAHSVAESCGKSPGIFSLENEEQLPEEAKDPSLIKELTLPPSAAAAAHADDLLGRHVDLMPLGQPGLDDHHYMLGGKMAAELDLEEAEPLAPGHHLGAQQSSDAGDNQPPYYSTICDKTDSFLAGNV